MITVDDALALDFKRDRWGRPLVVPANGGKAKPYTRSSSAAKTIEDTYNLELWARRNVVFGMARDASLVARVLAVGGDPASWNDGQKKAVNLVHEDAQKIAQAHKAADIGTALHKLTEQIDRGEIVVAGPYEPDIQAYVGALVAAGLSAREVECRMVCDSLEMAGTADRILVDAQGQFRIADLKTSATVDYGGLGWAAQLAAYAHGQLYDVTTDQRIATPKLDLEVGYIIHLPAGRGVCNIYEVDLVAGYRAAELANEIRAIRKASKTWITPLAAGAPPAAPTATSDHGTAYLSESDTAGTGLPPVTVPAEARPGDPFDGLEPMAPALVGIKANARRPVTLADLDQGAPIPDSDFDPLRKVTASLDAAAQSWLKGVITDAGGKGVAIKGQLHVRSFELLRGLVTLARNGHDDDELVRELAATALKSDEPFFATTVGQAVGILDASQASRFAALCVALCDDVTSVELRQRPAAA